MPKWVHVTVSSLPRWAWIGGARAYGSELAHVNRRYHWHMGRLRALICQSQIMQHPDKYGRALSGTVERAVREEMRCVEFEFKAWKEANGYDA